MKIDGTNTKVEDMDTSEVTSGGDAINTKDVAADSGGNTGANAKDSGGTGDDKVADTAGNAQVTGNDSGGRKFADTANTGADSGRTTSPERTEWLVPLVSFIYLFFPPLYYDLFV